MSFEQFTDIIVYVLGAILTAVGGILWNHNTRLTRVETLAVGTEKIREIVNSETKQLHNDIDKLDKKLDQIREAIGTRAADK